MSESTEQCRVIDIKNQVEARVKEEQEQFKKTTNETVSLSTDNILDGLKNNEDGDAWLFTQLNKNRFCYDHKRSLWHMWKENYWVEDEVENAIEAVETVVDAYAEEASRQAQLKIDATKKGDNNLAEKAEHIEKDLLRRIHALQTLRRKKNVLILAASGGHSLGISGDQWDSDPFLLGCKNAVIDLRTGTARPGVPLDYMKTVAPTKWHGLDAKAPYFDQFMKEIFNNDAELISFAKRLFGIAISGLSNEHIFPILWGDGRNGKTTLTETISEVIGELSGPIQSEMLLRQTFTRSSAGPSPDIMSLQGKRLVWANETDEGREINVGKVKLLAGGDTLVGRHVQGKKEIRFKPTHTLFLLTNKKPHIPPDDPAIWQRVFLIEFGMRFVDNPKGENQRKRDPNIRQKLLSEAPGILAWLVRGFMEYYTYGLNPPDSVKAATEKYREDEDVIGQFITECCALSHDFKQQAGPLYSAYKGWCESNSYTAIGSRKFGEKMVQEFERVEEGCRYYKGIKLITVVS